MEASRLAELRAMLAEARRKIEARDACAGHRLVAIERVERRGLKAWRCSACGAELDHGERQLYEQGRAHGYAGAAALARAAAFRLGALGGPELEAHATAALERCARILEKIAK